MAEGKGGAIRELLAVFGFQVDTEGLREGENRLSEFFEKVKSIGEGIAAAFAVEKIVEFAETNVRAMTSIEHAASRLGISAEKVQEFQFAARSMGMEAESLLNLMGRMQISQQAAAKGSGQAGQAFSAMGVKVRDTNGHMKSADELFLDVADGISKQTDASKQAALATQIFGRQGRELLPFLKEGRKGVEELGEEFKKLGGGYTEKSIEQSKQFEKQSARLGLAWTGLKNIILNALLPPLTWIFNKISSGVGWLRQITDGTHVFEIALGALAAVAIAFAAPMIAAAAPVLLLVAAMAGLVLLIDDIIGLFEGKDSLIGDGIDKLFGEGAHLDVVKSLKSYWGDIAEAVKTAAHYVKEFIDALGKVGGTVGDVAAQGINKISEITGTGAFTKRGLSYEQNVAARQAQRILESQITGAPLTIPEIPKGMSQGDLMQAAQEWMPAIQAGRFPQFSPQTFGPTNASSSSNVTVNVTTPTGLDAKQVGEHVANEVGKVIKSRHRAAANTLPRAPSE